MATITKKEKPKVKRTNKKGQGRKFEYEGGIMNFATTIPKNSESAVMTFVIEQRLKYKIKK